MFRNKLAALTLVSVAVFIAASPGTAGAATAPVVTGPTAESLAASKPVFNWTLGPAGEFVYSIGIGLSGSTAAVGAIANPNKGYLYPLNALTTTTTPVAANAGVYYWNAGWKENDASQTMYTPVASSTIPPIISVLMPRAIQDRNYSQLIARGSLTTNGMSVRMSFKVMQGAKLVAATRTTETIGVRPLMASTYSAYLVVPERLDGKRLRLVVTATVGTKVATSSRAFVAS